MRESPQGRTAGKIVEVEAYLSKSDPASHAHRGETKRNSSMFLPPFHAYVYQIYGTSFCLNVSSNEAGVGEAILIRALEPLDGLPLMMLRRGVEAVRDVCRGPGRLCQALAIEKALDGADLLKSPLLWIAEGGLETGAIRKSRRIGITKAASRHLRFYEAGSPYLSGPRHLSP